MQPSGWQSAAGGSRQPSAANRNHNHSLSLVIQITPQMRLLLAVEPADFRKGIDGLAKECRTALKSDPFSGAVFVFRNRRKTAVKLLVYDGQGFWLCTKRLSAGKFRYWPSSKEASSTSLQTYGRTSGTVLMTNIGDGFN